MARRRSSLAPLALLYAALIVYASLYPFGEWQAPRTTWWRFLTAEWPRWWTTFDLVSNLLGYLPLGLLVAGAAVRAGHGGGRSALTACAAAALLSFTLESLQNFLPGRVPSNVDLALNVAGAALGAAVAVSLQALGWMARWQSLRDRWFLPQAPGGLALLFAWPAALLFPVALPLGVGQVLDRAYHAWLDAVQDTPLQDLVVLPVDPAAFPPLAPAWELVAVTLGLLAPAMLAYSLTPPTWRRGVIVVLLAIAGFGATTLSTALNFGPHSALGWITDATPLGWGLGLTAAWVLVFLPPRAAAAAGLAMLLGLLVLVNAAPTDPYYASSLQAWEQGRFIRFHGLAQWLGWLWPYAALLYLLGRLLGREAAPKITG
ncbi:VanZ family protein [Schlegelella aquatica]|uniref:VanZ family protein n=1 Tax=Caldimonas aquatica TaxID=376175 RepID=UPI0037533AB6